MLRDGAVAGGQRSALTITEPLRHFGGGTCARCGRASSVACVAAGGSRRGRKAGGRALNAPTALRCARVGRIAQLTALAALSAFRQARWECQRSALRAPPHPLCSSPPRHAPAPAPACRDAGCVRWGSLSRDAGNHGGRPVQLSRRNADISCAKSRGQVGARISSDA
jgi:hypothetical protein